MDTDISANLRVIRTSFRSRYTDGPQYIGGVDCLQRRLVERRYSVILLNVKGWRQRVRNVFKSKSLFVCFSFDKINPVSV